MADVKMTVAEVNDLIRKVGIERVNVDGMTFLKGGTFLVKTDVDGRYVEIKVTAKNEDFSDETLAGLLDERAVIEKNKADRKVAADKKRTEKASKVKE